MDLLEPIVVDKHVTKSTKGQIPHKDNVSNKFLVCALKYPAITLLN